MDEIRWAWVLPLTCALTGMVLGAAAAAVTALVVVLSLGADTGTGSDDLAASRGADGSVDAMTAAEQHFIDGLYSATYQAFDDASLLDMGHGYCGQLDTGASLPGADADLVAGWDGLDLDAAYDVEWEATHHLCRTHAGRFEQWDPTAPREVFSVTAAQGRRAASAAS